MILNVEPFLKRVRDMLDAYKARIGATAQDDGMALLLSPKTWSKLCQAILPVGTIESSAPKLYGLYVILTSEVPLGDVYMVMPPGHRFLEPTEPKSSYSMSGTWGDSSGSLGIFQQQQGDTYTFTPSHSSSPNYVHFTPYTPPDPAVTQKVLDEIETLKNQTIVFPSSVNFALSPFEFKDNSATGIAVKPPIKDDPFADEDYGEDPGVIVDETDTW